MNLFRETAKTLFPKPGLRILKTGMAVLICLYIDCLRGGAALPFYSCIAAILCMQAHPKTAVKMGTHRMLATLIGGCYGYAVTVAALRMGIRGERFWNDTLVGVSIMLLIYLTVLFRQQQVSYLACVVSLSISLAHGSDPDPLAFALARVLDTLIGVTVSILINVLPFLRNRRLPPASD